jgi:hypothetical protein
MIHKVMALGNYMLTASLTLAIIYGGSEASKGWNDTKDGKRGVFSSGTAKGPGLEGCLPVVYTPQDMRTPGQQYGYVDGRNPNCAPGMPVQPPSDGYIRGRGRAARQLYDRIQASLDSSSGDKSAK